MDEYISREDVKNALLNKGQQTTRYRLGETWELNFMEILEALDTIPSADVQPVKRGRWIDHEQFERENCNVCIECSVCNTWFGHDCIPKTKFCPNCGARMTDEGR